MRKDTSRGQGTPRRTYLEEEQSGCLRYHSEICGSRTSGSMPRLLMGRESRADRQPASLRSTPLRPGQRGALPRGEVHSHRAELPLQGRECSRSPIDAV
ncbi:hypothetical protein NDU88_004459 [Pleurodeles waltl]|uniref:Uncharacterized protein n=1 Tax=Pleurodeles waltl TaxID=8319 RepID=A0AAV7M753_PLEWA|nr:hypothetical protein NDU88_004459 [Pleurodeles waltl]